jgi:hypothetical protein
MPIQTFIDAVTGKTRKRQIQEIEDKASGKKKKKPPNPLTPPKTLKP